MEQNNTLLIFQFLLRIIGVFICYNQAKTLNRNAGSWAIAGFFFPVIAIIWIFCMKRKPYKNNEPTLGLKPFTKYYTENGLIEVETAGEKRVSINGNTAPDGQYKLNRFETIEVFNGKIK
ncbi:hypothetical protein QGN23_03730 [Chryseobacterium gotjawalense]|uniref:Uncharacterized protein n=1 Tax=Chryseobacterium gotjawalense TaxID=3042315 RepID=A0ABY8REW7_9FLAO|nr:hypothetical protein [Chryseobacterium sp. wdc7]WHF52396.1 hypothetical protein QGN23_03730 [Chryseobacterium sp. wdc7]